MTTYYVNSSTGNNANTGLSTTAAWKTIQFAVTNAAIGAGDVIKLSGTFTENVLISDGNGGRQSTSGERIVLESLDANNPAVLTGSGGFTTARLRILNRSGWEVRSLLFQDYTGSGVRIDHSSPTYGSMSNIVVDRCTFRNQTATVGGASAISASLFSNLHVNGNAQIDNLRIANCTMTNIRSGVDGTAYNECLSIAGKVRRVVIENNIIDGATFIAINIVGDMYVPPHPTLASIGWPEKIVVRGNTVKNCKPSYLEGGSAWAGMIYANKARWVLIEDNYIENSTSWPLVGIGITGEPYSGITGLPSLDTYIVRNNVVKGRGYGIYLGTQNSIYSATKNVERAAIVHNALDMSSDPTFPLGWLDAKDNAIKNNVFLNQGSAYLSYTGANQVVGTGNVSDGNLWYATQRTQSTALWFWRNTQYTGFAAYKTGSGQDANGVWGLPEFEATYQLKSTSPGYGVAVPLTTTGSSGSNSTSVAVGAGFYFYDGWGIPGEIGDTITIGGLSATVTAVTGNTLTIGAALTWSSAAPVAYANGASIGLESLSAPVSPIVCDWTSVSVAVDAIAELGFRVERGGTGSWVEIALLAADTVGYNDDNLVSGTTYAYRVGAYNDAGTSYSNIASATTLGSPTLPPPPPEDNVVGRSFLSLPLSNRVLTVRKHVR